jgi:hypothetical protein
VVESIKQILGVLNNQIDSVELNAAIKADNFEGEFAISEDGLTAIIAQTQDLLSIESAVANPVVIERINKESYPKHMKSALSKVEEKLKPIYDKVGVDYSSAEYLSDLIGEIEAKIDESASKGDNKGVIESLNKELREAKEALDNKDAEFNTRITEREQAYLDERIKDKFMLKANEYKWADIYSIPKLKKDILTGTWETIKAKAHLKLSNDGEILVMQKDMPDKELYNGNKIETFQSLLEPELQDYLMKSDPKKVNKSEPKAQAKDDDLTPKQREMIAQKAKFMVS